MLLSLLEILVLHHGIANLPTTTAKVESPFWHRVGRFCVTFGRLSFKLFLPSLTPGRRLRGTV